jgi:Asp-tRNA(Asn)/Glu-tRNA(Gln) amidotransferase A subunit family amidase
LARERRLWRGSIPLAESFDTLGWLFRDLRDGPLLAKALFGLDRSREVDPRVRIGCAAAEFATDSDLNVRQGFAAWQKRLADRGAEIAVVDSGFWDEAMDIYVPIQAYEAARYHGSRTGDDFSHFHAASAQRMTWGLTISEDEIARWRGRLAAFCSKMKEILAECDFLMVPGAPVSRLCAGADHSGARKAILRYTTPFSLPGLPVVALTARDGAGVQLIAASGEDARLLEFAARL